MKLISESGGRSSLNSPVVGASRILNLVAEFGLAVSSRCGYRRQRVVAPGGVGGEGVARCDRVEHLHDLRCGGLVAAGKSGCQFLLQVDGEFLPFCRRQLPSLCNKPGQFCWMEHVAVCC